VLSRLELRLGGRLEPSRARLEDLAPLFARTDLLALTHLKLRGWEHAGEALTVLAGTALARQLVVVDLSHGLVEPSELGKLAGHITEFPALRELWLPSGVMPEAERRLAGIATHLISDARGALDTFPGDVALRRDP
jgi:hypothetical protein